MTVRSPGRPLHLARRFVGSLRHGDVSPADAAWVRARLLDGEADLWVRMSDADRRHAVGVARRVDGVLDGAPRPVLAAALLHDVGKVTSGLGTWARVVATLLGAVTSADAHGRWAARGGALGRLGRYLRHPDEGAALLSVAGSDPLTVAWAAEHHHPRSRWTVEASVAEALWSADDD
jgi:hypothetical protein